MQTGPVVIFEFVTSPERYLNEAGTYAFLTTLEQKLKKLECYPCSSVISLHWLTICKNNQGIKAGKYLKHTDNRIYSKCCPQNVTIFFTIWYETENFQSVCVGLKDEHFCNKKNRNKRSYIDAMGKIQWSVSPNALKNVLLSSNYLKSVLYSVFETARTETSCFSK